MRNQHHLAAVAVIGDQAIAGGIDHPNTAIARFDKFREKLS